MVRRAGARRAGQQRTPWLILPLAAVAVAYVAVPFVALLQRAPWSDLGGLLGRSIVVDALRLSITTAFAATGLAMLLGIPLAWVLARTRFPGRSVARALVTLPMVAPSVIAGAVLCWARALGEFGATVTFAGNLQGRTQTMPLAVFLALESDRDAAIALSLVLVAVSLAVLVPLRDRWLAA